MREPTIPQSVLDVIADYPNGLTVSMVKDILKKKAYGSYQAAMRGMARKGDLVDALGDDARIFYFHPKYKDSIDSRMTVAKARREAEPYRVAYLIAENLKRTAREEAEPYRVAYLASESLNESGKVLSAEEIREVFEDEIENKEFLSRVVKAIKSIGILEYRKVDRKEVFYHKNHEKAFLSRIKKCGKSRSDRKEMEIKRLAASISKNLKKSGKRLNAEQVWNALGRRLAKKTVQAIMRKAEASHNVKKIRENYKIVYVHLSHMDKHKAEILEAKNKNTVSESKEIATRKMKSTDVVNFLLEAEKLMTMKEICDALNIEVFTFKNAKFSSKAGEDILTVTIGGVYFYTHKKLKRILIDSPSKKKSEPEEAVKKEYIQKIGIKPTGDSAMINSMWGAPS